VTEKELDAAVRKIARLYGWRVYHTYRSTRSPAGFPDLVMVKPPRLIFAELKSDEGKVSAEQAEWLTDLRAVACLVYDAATCGSGSPVDMSVETWRPRDLDEIARALGPR
jgi:hypothetical protein